MNNRKFKEVELSLVNEGFCSFSDSWKLMDDLKIRKPSERSGIYVHVAFVGEETWYYVGLSKDVRKRFTQHIKNHTDFVKSCWLQAPVEELVQLELKYMILLQSHGVLLRNTLKPRASFKWSDYKPIFQKESTDAWCESHTISAERHVWDNYELETIYQKRFNQLEADKDFNDRILDLINDYVRKCIFLHPKTEQIFWNITCMNPGLYEKPFNRNKAFVRINIHMPETFTIVQNHTDPKYPPLDFNFHVAKDRLSLESVKRIEKQFQTRARPGNYKRTGGEQIQFAVDTIEQAFALLEDKEFVRAIRYGNTRLMQMGLLARRLSQSHCLPLAKAALTRSA